MSSGNNAKQNSAYFIKPAFQAFYILVVSHFFTLLITAGIWKLVSFQINLVLAMLLQGSIAALLSRYRKLAFWWVVIQFIFPVALLMTHSIGLPSWIFLFIFVFLLSLYWTTFRTQVPFYPTGRITWKAISAFVPEDKKIHFVDIGSGMGGLILNLAAQRPESTFTGIEIAPLPYFVSWLSGKFYGSHARFMRGDYRALNFSQFDIVFAYLSPAAMPALWDKSCREMRKGGLLLSYEFLSSARPPDHIIQPKQDGPYLYAWVF